MNDFQWRLKGASLLLDKAIPWDRRMALLSMLSLTETTRTLAAPGVAKEFRRDAVTLRQAARAMPDVVALFSLRRPTLEEEEDAREALDLADIEDKLAAMYEARARQGSRGGGAAGSPILAKRNRALQRWLHDILVEALEAPGDDPARAAARALSEVLAPLPGVEPEVLLLAVRAALGGRERTHSTQARAVVDGISDRVDASELEVPRLAPLSHRHWRRILAD